MLERMQALSAVGRLDGMLYEILQTKHELISVLSDASHPLLLEETVGQIVNIVV